MERGTSYHILSALHGIVRRVAQWAWSGVLASLVASELFNAATKGALVSPAAVWDAARARWLWLLAFVLALALLTAWGWWDAARTRRDAVFDLYKNIDALRPEDLGFATPNRRRPVTLLERVFPPLYIPRQLTPYDGGRAYPLEGVARALTRQHNPERGILLIGSPLTGKKRTLYALIRELSRFGYTLVRPHPRATHLPATAFKRLRGRPVLVVLDRLERYVSVAGHLQNFLERVAAATDGEYCIVATCSDGAQYDSALHHLPEVLSQIPVRLTLAPPTADEKMCLAAALGLDLDAEEAQHYPSLGSIAHADALTKMADRARFPGTGYTPDMRRLLQDVLHALTGLAVLGVSPPHALLADVLAQFYRLRSLNLQAALDELRRQGFIYPPADADPVVPEIAYLLDPTIVPPSSRDPSDDALVTYLAARYVEKDDLATLLTLDHAALRRGVEEATMQQLTEALAVVLHDPAAWMKRSKALLRARYYEALDGSLTRATKLGYRDTSGLQALDALALEERAPESVLLRIGQALFPLWLDPIPYINRGRRLSDARYYTAAIASLERALQLNPDDPGEVWMAIGNAWCLQGQFDRQLYAAEQVLALNADDVRGLAQKASALRLLEIRLDEALAAANRALALDQNYNSARFERAALLHWEYGRHNEAWPEACRVVNMKPGVASYWVLLGSVANVLGRFQEARKAYEHACQLNPTDVVAKAQLSALLGISFAEYDKGVQIAKSAIALDAMEPYAWAASGLNLVKLRQNHHALDAYKRVAKLAQPGTALYLVAQWSIGDIYSRLHQYDEAIAAYDQAIETARPNPRAWLGKARTLCCKGLQFRSEAQQCTEQAWADRHALDAGTVLSEMIVGRNQRDPRQMIIGSAPSIKEIVAFAHRELGMELEAQAQSQTPSDDTTEPDPKVGPDLKQSPEHIRPAEDVAGKDTAEVPQAACLHGDYSC